MQLGSLKGAALGLLVAAATMGTAAAAGSGSGPVLVRDVQTGSDRLGSALQPSTPDEYIQPDTQIEPSIAVNPNNPQNVVIGYQEGRVDGGGDATNGYAVTFDGGQTWTNGEMPGLTSYPDQTTTGPFDRASDAVVAFGPNNDVYFSSLVFNSESSSLHTGNGNVDSLGQAARSGMAINVSHNGGRTWSGPVFFDDDQLDGLNDKNWVVVDNSSAAGHHKGRVYVVWDRVIAGMVYDYCDPDPVVGNSGCDNLSNWAFGGKFQVDMLPTYVAEAIGSYPLVLPDGSLGIIFDSQEGGAPVGIQQDQSETLLTDTSSVLTSVVARGAGSVPFGAPLVFGPPVAIAGNDSTGVRAQRAGSLPSAAVDPVSGTMYVAWEDGRLHTEANPVNDIMVSSSTDEGLTWSAPLKVNVGTTTDYLDNYNAMISVSPDEVVHVGYMQRQEADHLSGFSPSAHTVYQESSDGGKTWSAPLRVDSFDNNLYYGAFSRHGTFQGDYNEIASANGVSYIVRASSAPATPGEPPALVPDPAQPDQLILPDTGKGHQHQAMWVSVISSEPGTNVPETAWTPVLLLIGGPLLGLQVLRRRRRARLSA
jgi:hypothetical protein